MLQKSNTVELFTKKVGNFINNNFIYVDENLSLKEGIKLLQNNKKSTILLKNHTGLSGIITEKDIMRKFTFKIDGSQKLKEVMTKNVKFVYYDDLLFHAVGKMRKNNFNHLPVLNHKYDIVGMIDMNQALSAELGNITYHIDRMTFDEDDKNSLKKIKENQIEIAESMLNRNLFPFDITFLLSFLNNVIYRRAIRLAEKKISQLKIIERIPKYSVIVMGSGGRMESFLHPDQDNGIIYETSNEYETSKVEKYFKELSKIFTKTLNDCGIPFCKGNLMASNPLWRKSLSDWKKQIDYWLFSHKPQDMRNIDMLYDFRSVYGHENLAVELKKYINKKFKEKKYLKFLYFSEEQSDAAIGFFGQFILEKNDEENKGLLNLKHTGTLPLVESIRLYSIKSEIIKTNTLDRLDELEKLEVFNKDDIDFYKNAYKFMSNLLLKNQVNRAKKGLEIKNFIDPKYLSFREKKILKLYLKKVRELKKKVRGDIGEEYF